MHEIPLLKLRGLVFTQGIMRPKSYEMHVVFVFVASCLGFAAVFLSFLPPHHPFFTAFTYAIRRLLWPQAQSLCKCMNL